MNKKYVFYQVKKLLPLYGILLAFLGIVVVTTFSTTSGFSYSYYHGTINITNQLIPLFVITILFTYITPFFSLGYRFKSSRADIYLQLPFKKNALKITNLLIHIVMTAICFIVAGLFLILLLFIKQAINNPYSYHYVTTVFYEDPNGGGILTDYIETSTHITYYYNYGFYFLSLILMAFFIAVEQVINNFIASFTNNKFDCFLYLVMFFIVRFLLLFLIGVYILASIYYYTPMHYFDIDSMFYLNLSPVSAGFFVHYLVSAGASGLSPSYYFTYFSEYGGSATLAIVFVSVFLYIALGVVAFLYQMFATEKCGENLGRKRNKTFVDYFLPHLAMITSFFLWPFLSLAGALIVDSLFSFASEIVFYYALLALLSRSFKVSKKDLITAGIVLGSMAILWAQIMIAQNYYLSH